MRDMRAPARRPDSSGTIHELVPPGSDATSEGPPLWQSGLVREDPVRHGWEDWVWDETAFEGTAPTTDKVGSPTLPLSLTLCLLTSTLTGRDDSSTSAADQAPWPCSSLIF
jgi:hypothetical protein